MPDVSTAVEDYANALRATMHAGDQVLADNSADRKILQAVVVDSAEGALEWVQTRVQNGDVVGKPLEVLAPALAKGNMVGGGLKVVREQVVKEATAVVTSAISGAAAPAWFASAVAIVLGLFAFAQDAGASFGAALIPALLGGGSVAVALIRLAAASPPALKTLGDAAGSAWTNAGTIGISAAQVFREHAGPAQEQLATHGYRPPATSPVLVQLRGGAQSILGVTYAVLAVCAVFFAVGVMTAFNAWADEQCFGGRYPDGTCIGQ